MKSVRLTIFLSVFCSTLGMMIIMPILAPLIRELGLTESQGGWMVSVGSITMAIMGGWWGPKSDHVGRKPIIMIGFAGLFITYVVYTAVIAYGLKGVLAGVPLLVSLIVGRALVGLFLSAVPAACQAFMADITTTEDRASGMALIGSANGLGMIAGPAIGGVVVLAGLIWPMVLATVLPLLALALAFFTLPNTPPKERPTTQRLSPFDPSVRRWLLVGLFTMLTIVTLQISAGFYFQDRLGLTGVETARMLALSLTLVGGGLLVTQIVQMKVLRWKPRRLILTGAPIHVLALLILLLTASQSTYMLAYALFGIASGLVIPGYMSGASMAVAGDRQGAAAGLIAMTQGAGAIFAPIISTTLYELSPRTPFMVITVLCCLAFVTALTLPKPINSPAPAAKG